MCAQKIKRPTKPKVPVEPTKPLEFIERYEVIANDYIVHTTIVQLMKRIAEKLGVEPQNIDWNSLLLNFDGVITIEKIVQIPNDNLEREEKTYQAALKKYKKDAETFDERMKLYKTLNPVWLAWKYSKKQDELRSEMEHLDKKIRKLELQKERLLGKENEVPEDNS